MGANGSFASGATTTEKGRRWQTIYILPDGTKVIELKKKGSIKLPEESHTPNSVYAIFNKDGKGVKAIAKYSDDGKKIWEIHTTDHHHMGAHFHYWKDGKPVEEEPHGLTSAMNTILNNVLNMK